RASGLKFLCGRPEGENLEIYGDGKQTRSFAYVSDLVEGLIRMMEAPDFVGPVNLGNPDEFTILELASMVLEYAGSSSKRDYKPARPDDPVKRRPDISLARAKLKWEPKTPLREGLRTTMEHFRSLLGIERA